MGKQTEINKKANKKLKKLFGETHIRSCELQLEGCTGSWGLQFAHRHKRAWYYPQPDKLVEFNQVVLSCPVCHRKIEYDKELTKRMFKKLRGTEI
jgi:hypothetical protein